MKENKDKPAAVPGQVQPVVSREAMMDKIEKERNAERKRQAKAVMPLIGRLLDAWYDLPTDVRCDDELSRLGTAITAIDEAMEDNG